MTTLRHCLLAACVLLAGAPAACAPEDILLANRQQPLEDAATPPPAEEEKPDAEPEEKRCKNRGDCGDPGQYCSKNSCGSERGTCQRLPTVCPQNADPVCGCNGITYFNDCLREQDGISAATDDQCNNNAVPCGGSANALCPPRTFCAKRLRDLSECSPIASGVCWSMPTVCGNDASNSNRWRLCGGPSGQCLDTCRAIKSGVPYDREESCSQ